MKSVFLRTFGEPPTWDPAVNGHLYVDAKIVAARAGADITEQKKLYMDLAVHLHRNRLPGSGGDPLDHSDDTEWLRRLAAYFGWSEEFHQRVDAEAVKGAYTVPNWAIEDAEVD